MQPETIRKNFVLTEPIDRILVEMAAFRGIPASEIVRAALVAYFRDDCGIESEELRQSVRLTGGAKLGQLEYREKQPPMHGHSFAYDED